MGFVYSRAEHFKLIKLPFVPNCLYDTGSIWKNISSQPDVLNNQKCLEVISLSKKLEDLSNLKFSKFKLAVKQTDYTKIERWFQ